MLTLIVVVAAGSFAVFVSQKQEAAQQQQLYDQHKQQEALAIMGLNPNRTSNGNFDQLNFTLASNHNLDSRIVKVTVNNHVLREFWVWGADQPLEKLNWSSKFIISSHQQLNINITPDDFFENGITIDAGGFVEIAISTDFQNTFSRLFMPPSALLRLNTESQWDPAISNFKDFLILDGSGSTAQGESFIVSYQWNISSVNDPMIYVTYTGMKARADFPSNGDYWVNLTVADNHGMIGVDSIIYHY